MGSLPVFWQGDRGSIDPGVKACAFAVSRPGDRVVYAVASVPPLADAILGARLGSMIVELPEANGRTTPPDDLIRMTAAGFLLAGQITANPVRAVTPRTWKGTTPKPAHHRRLWAALAPAEKLLLGGEQTHAAIAAACQRGARDGWSKDGKRYYLASELPTIRGVKITHDILDAVALNLFDSGRLAGP